MAKKSKIAKNEKRKEIVARYAERRNELKAIIRNPETSDEDRLEAQFELNRQPRDASPARVRNRDSHDGRPRGYLRKFGLSRVRMRGGNRADVHQRSRGYGRGRERRRAADGSARTAPRGALRPGCSGS